MPQRFLRPGITTSDSWNSCGFEAQSLFVRLLTVCDDYGRYDGRGAVVHGHCFALRQDVTIERTRELIEELSENSLVETYEVGGKQFLRITRWQERARGVSKYPSPPNELPTGEAIGSIYFVRAGKGDRIKIGYTQFTPEERLRRLQVGSSEKLILVAVISGTLREERALHRQFSADNVGGEWFRLSDELKAFIASRSKSTHTAGKSRIPQAEDASLAIAIVPSPSPAVGAKESRTTLANGLVDSEWVAKLRQDKTYSGIDVDRELGKMSNWCSIHGKQPSCRRFINWLNRADKPLEGNSSTPKRKFVEI